MCKEHEKDKPAQRPGKYGDVINNLYGNYHKMILPFPL